jgi:hypothetical protein
MAALFWSSAWFWALCASALYLTVLVLYLQHRDYVALTECNAKKLEERKAASLVQFRAGDYLFNLVPAAFFAR